MSPAHRGRWFSAVGTRILASALVTALAALAVVWFTTHAFSERFAREMDRTIVTPDDVALCGIAPERWSKEVGGFLSVHAYDPSTGRSRNPGAPPLALERFDGVPEVGAVVSNDRGPGHDLLVRAADSGPCALYRVSIRPPRIDMFVNWATAAGLAVVLALFAVAGLTMGLAVRPLQRRIHALSSAASGVGAEGYRSAEDEVGDELSAISAVLDGSHARITADRAELVARHEALERHMAEIAHDLRTPLASLLLATEELSSGSAAGGDADGRGDVAARALEDVVYLEALVGNLHQATLLRHGLDPGACGEGSDLGQIVARVAGRFAALGRRRGVTVDHAVPEGPVPVRCPWALVERAIANLVHNAVVHGRPGGHVAILLEHTQGRFSLTVLDDGPGAPPETLASLAHRTFRADGVRPRDQGLGIVITNEVCARAGWAIRYLPMEPSGLKVEIAGASEG